MITALTKAITNPTLISVAQNTNASVATETTLKAIGRPGFILIDNDIDADTKKYAAAKEFLYQATCLVIYMILVVPVFKKGAFKIAKKYIYKGDKGFDKFKSAQEYLEYHKLAEKSVTNRTASLSKDHSVNKFSHDNLRQDLLNEKKPELYSDIKGSIELGSLIGSVFGLAILAPQISHLFIHPALNFLGLEKSSEPNKIENNNEQKIDVKA